ncbi:MAG TPA: RES family NAD+ phosphorylase [Chthoniobacterales bacterium]|nr:RES family NAD+ phosphorylase [Chthoniobacterales bacterium]
MARTPRDPVLVDLVDACAREAFSGLTWRIAHHDRDPVQGFAVRGRFDSGVFDVLYTSLAPGGAKAEVFFHLSRQPVFPSKLVSVLYRIAARAGKTLRLVDMTALERLGVERNRYQEILYTRTQEIGDAAYFLGFDGILAPSARWACLNLVLFTERLTPDDLRIEDQEVVDWEEWKRQELSRKS